MLIPWSPTQSNLMNRLRTILLEDIGVGCLGMLPLADVLLSRAERARDAFFRGVAHDANVLVYRRSILRLVDMMSRAPRKTRFLSHALCVLAKESSDWVAQNIPEFCDLHPGPLVQELTNKNVLAIGSVYKFYEAGKAKFPANEAAAVFEASQSAAPSRAPIVAVLQKWFKRGYSENELAVYSAILVAVFRDCRRPFAVPASSDCDASVVFSRLTNQQAPPEPLDVVSCLFPLIR